MLQFMALNDHLRRPYDARMVAGWPAITRRSMRLGVRFRGTDLVRSPGRREGTMHVLIVDDDPVVRVALSEMLGDEGYETSTASTGRSALELLRSGLRPS